MATHSTEYEDASTRPRVQLPFEIDIPIRSYLDHALPLSIVAHDPHHLEALFGSFVQMFFPDEKLEYDRVLMLPSLKTADWERLGFLSTQLADARAVSLGHQDGVCDFLVEQLDRGRYVEAQIDEFFLPGRPCHLKVHSVHDNMIVGYDLESHAFLVAGYGRDYEIADMPFDDVARSFLDVPITQRHRRLLRTVWRRDDVPHAFDFERMIAQLDDYLESRATMTPDEIRDAGLYWKARRFTGAWGLQAYDALIDYLTRLVGGGRELDLRVTRTWWEHKACMRARIAYLEANGYVDAGLALSRQYTAVERLATSIRFAAYEYHASGHRPTPTAQFVDTLRTMRQSEAAVLGRLLHACRHRASGQRESVGHA